MRVALDVTARITGATGVSRYAVELDAALRRLGVDVTRYTIGRGPFPSPPETRRIPIPLRMMHATWERTGRPRIERFIGSPDVVHTLDMVAPPTRLPSVVTVQDLEAIVHPDLHPPRAVSIQRAEVEALDRVDVVAVSSRATGELLVARGVPAEKVVHTPFGHTPLPPAPPVSILGGMPYVLCVGKLEKRKGQELLIEAINDERLGDWALVLAGPDGLGAEEMRAVAGDRVVFEGKVSDERLSGLYGGASAFALTSRAEGFGLPVVEAMASGLPVVISDIPPLVELADGVGIAVALDDIEGLVTALHRVLSDPSVAADMHAKGLERAKRYTWEACAAATIAVYERAINATR